MRRRPRPPNKLVIGPFDLRKYIKDVIRVPVMIVSAWIAGYLTAYLGYSLYHYLCHT